MRQKHGGKELADSFDEQDTYISALEKIKEAFENKKSRDEGNTSNRFVQQMKKLLKKNNLLR